MAVEFAVTTQFSLIVLIVLIVISTIVKQIICLNKNFRIPAAQSTAMPRIPLRPIPDVTMLRNPEPSGLIRLTPFCVATVLLKSHQ